MSETLSLKECPACGGVAFAENKSTTDEYVWCEHQVGCGLSINGIAAWNALPRKSDIAAAVAEERARVYEILGRHTGKESDLFFRVRHEIEYGTDKALPPMILNNISEDSDDEEFYKQEADDAS